MTLALIPALIPALLPAAPEQIGYWLCAIMFLPVAGWSALSPLPGMRKALMLLACLTTSLWAAAMALTQADPAVAPDRLALASAAEILRDGIWVAFLLSMPGVGRLVKRLTGRTWPIALLAALAAVTGFVVLAAGNQQTIGSGGAAACSPQLILAILILVLLENLYRNSAMDARWGIKALCVGLGLIFLFDFIVYADALFAGRTDLSLLQGRGFVDALAAPLLLLSVRRSHAWRLDISLSRGVAFHSAVLLAGGLYLLAIAAMDMALRWVGGSPVLQLLFLASSLLAMMLIFSSHAIRSKLRALIGKNFFLLKYDYRAVWLKFIRDLSQHEEGGDLQNRILHAVADIFDCPAGALWVLDEEAGGFLPTARWNLGDALPTELIDGALISSLNRHGAIIPIRDFSRNPGRYPGVKLPAWLMLQPRAWLLAPLLHKGRLQAFLLLGTPRASVEISWEERDLLATISVHAASCLAEEQSLRALVDASRLDDLNRWSAFLLHDLKGVVGQMSLLVTNAERHAHDHEFQRDVVATVANSVLRMRKMLELLTAQSSAPRAVSLPLDAVALLRQVGERWRRSIPSLDLPDEMRSGARSMLVDAREEALVSVLDHLIETAFEASGSEGRIALSLRWHGREGMMEVHDNGPGMDASFVQNRLFKPMTSDKPHSMGLGAFQVRQLVRDMGGKLEVDSVPGKGTTMRVRLPILAASNRSAAKGLN
jgi:putative PEP-CTERM system histidine kinase